MKKIKLLIPALGTVAALSAVAPAVSCGTPKEDDKKTYKVELDESCKDYFTLSVSKIEEGHDLFLTITSNEGYGFNTSYTPVVKIGTTEVDVSETTILGVTKTQIAIEAEKINGNISIAAKQQVLSYSTFSVDSPIASVNVSIDENGTYIQETDLSKEHRFEYSIDPDYKGDALYLYVTGLDLVDTTTGQTVQDLTFVEPGTGTTLKANQYTYDISSGIFNNKQTVIVGAGTFSTSKSYTLKAHLYEAKAEHQNVILHNPEPERPDMYPVEALSDSYTTEGLLNGTSDGIHVKIKENFASYYALDESSGTYSAKLQYYDYTPIPLTISNVSVDEHGVATISFTNSSLSTMWNYYYYDLVVTVGYHQIG